jgi:hypothetical protein
MKPKNASLHNLLKERLWFGEVWGIRNWAADPSQYKSNIRKIGYEWQVEGLQQTRWWLSWNNSWNNWIRKWNYKVTKLNYYWW